MTTKLQPAITRSLRNIRRQAPNVRRPLLSEAQCQELRTMAALARDLLATGNVLEAQRALAGGCGVE